MVVGVIAGGANYYERVGHVSSIRHPNIIRFDPRMPFGTSRSLGEPGRLESFDAIRDALSIRRRPATRSALSPRRVDNHVIFLSTLFRHASHNSGPTGYPSGAVVSA